MKVLFEVKKEGRAIYSMDFPVDEPDQFGEFSKLALQDFRVKYPNVSLLADDVIMSWSKA